MAAVMQMYNSCYALRAWPQKPHRGQLKPAQEEVLYTKIMVPVDLVHADKLGKALRIAADLGNHYGIPVCYVAVTASTPTPAAHNPSEFAAKLAAFAEAQAAEHGHVAESRSYASHDPAIDLDPTLLKAVQETGSDLVVMASHVPDLVDYVWPSNGGTIASHSDVSVFLVR